MHQWTQLAVSTDSTIREVMEVIDSGAVEIALVTDGEERLLGTVTDGDIRRAILRSLPPGTPIEEVMNRAFTSVGPEESDPEVRSLMNARGIKQIPVLDAEGRLLGLHLLRELVETHELPNWAVIMAGGEGRRLRPMTRDVPKPMLRIGERPLLDRTVRRLVGYGIRRIFLSVHYLGHQIEEYFGDGQRFGCRIEFLREETPLGTGGALSLLTEFPAHPILVMNGDLLTDVNISALLDYHAQNAYAATLCVTQFSYQVPYGVVQIDKQTVQQIQEKPTQEFFVNAGIYVLNPEHISRIPQDTPFQLPELITHIREAGLQVGAFPVREYWVDIGKLEDYQRAVEDTRALNDD